MGATYNGHGQLQDFYMENGINLATATTMYTAIWPSDTDNGHVCEKVIENGGMMISENKINLEN